MDTKECKNCGKIFERQKYDGPLAWSKRKYCSTKCYSIDHHALADQKHKRMTKVCVYCGELYTPTYNASTAIWKSRKYCSTDCAVLGKEEEKDILSIRRCKKCGVLYDKPKDMKFKTFITRDYCFQCHY